MLESEGWMSYLVFSICWSPEELGSNASGRMDFQSFQNLPLVTHVFQQDPPPLLPPPLLYSSPPCPLSPLPLPPILPPIYFLNLFIYYI